MYSRKKWVNIAKKNLKGGATGQFKFVGTCESCNSIVKESDVSSPSKCTRGLKIATKLGSGDVGVAYELKPGAQNKAINSALDSNGIFVLKEVLIKNKNELKQFNDEVCIGKYLGDIGVAPKIYNCWVCFDSADSNVSFPLKAYYVMDKIDKIWKDAFPSGLNRGNKPASKNMEMKLVDVLERMIAGGIIHQDNHPGNIGIMANGDVVLFDFGFSVIALQPITYPETILMSQLYIVIEQYNKDIMFDSYLYDVIYAIRRGEYKSKHF